MCRSIGVNSAELRCAGDLELHHEVQGVISRLLTVNASLGPRVGLVSWAAQVAAKSVKWVRSRLFLEETNNACQDASEAS